MLEALGRERGPPDLEAKPDEDQAEAGDGDLRRQRARGRRPARAPRAESAT
jgi:hypothetical protein